MLGGDAEQPDIGRDRCAGPLGIGRVADVTQRAGFGVVRARELGLDGK